MYKEINLLSLGDGFHKISLAFMKLNELNFGINFDKNDFLINIKLDIILFAFQINYIHNKEKLNNLF